MNAPAAAPIKVAPLSEKPTLTELQEHIRAVVAQKGWSTDPNEIFVLFTEEVGELAKELRRAWKHGNGAVRENAAAELADVLMYLLDLANTFDVDLEQAMRKKLAYNETRTDFGH